MTSLTPSQQKPLGAHKVRKIVIWSVGTLLLIVAIMVALQFIAASLY